MRATTARGTALAIAAVAAAVALAACGGRAAPAPRPTGPAVALTLPAADGGELDLAAYRGQIVVLHVFAVWSMEATADVAQLAEADARDDVTVVGIAMDLEGYTVVAPWRAALGVRYLLALADEPLRAGDTPLGAIRQVPTTIVLDRAGRVAARIERPLADGELAATIAAVDAR